MKYPTGFEFGQLCVREPPTIIPGLKRTVVPVYEISIVEPFVTDSMSRRKDTS